MTTLKRSRPSSRNSKEEVRCIYIDPPYNTGNESWVYDDNVNDPRITKWLGQIVGREGEDLSRHDKWLCMMYPRLKLLRQLLSQDGSIWISIDDNEQAGLKLMMDEIFGEGNFIANVIWQKVYAPKNSAMYFSEDHDYILVYARDKSRWRPNLLARSHDQNGALVCLTHNLLKLFRHRLAEGPAITPLGAACPP